MEELTESARQCLVSQGIVIGAISILNSLGLSLLGIMVLSRAQDLLQFTSLTHLATLEIVCGITSFFAVIYVWCVTMGYRNRHIELRSKYLDENMSRALLGLTLPTILCFSALIVGSIFLMIKTDTNSIYDLKSAMSLYSSDITRKVIIDRIQMLLQCCGSQTLLDWFLVDWQDADFEPGVHILNLSFSDWDSVPYSCCSTDAPPPCIHHQLRIFGVGSLYTTGCSDKLDDAVFIYIMLSVAMFSIGTFSMLFMLYSSRKLQTSARAAVIKGDSTAPGSWWLLSPAGSVHTNVSDVTPLLEPPKQKKQKTISCVALSPKRNKPCPSPPPLITYRSKNPEKAVVEDWETMKTSTKANDDDSSEDWTRKACDETGSTSSASFITSTRPFNSTPETKRSVTETVEASVEPSRFGQESRPLYRT